MSKGKTEKPLTVLEVLDMFDVRLGYLPRCHIDARCRCNARMPAECARDCLMEGFG
jgi:hypothetical protein